MHSRNWLAAALALLATLSAVKTASASQSAQDDKLRAFGGEWFYVEDRTKDRPLEKQGPPMFMRFKLRIEKDAAVEKANNMQIALGRERLMWKVSLRQAGRRRRQPPPLARLILTIQITFMRVLPIY